MCLCVSGNACGYLISHPWEELHLYVMGFICVGTSTSILFDLLKYGFMLKYNVMGSSLDPMEELKAPAGAGCGLG